MKLVPTRVGMILNVGDKVGGLNACPHTRGDDPHCQLRKWNCQNLSPHAWG